MRFKELYKEDNCVYMRPIMIDKRRIKEHIHIDRLSENYQELCEEDIRYSMACFVLILNDGSKIFGR